MADEQVPFSPLDPLGPEYGRGDLPIIDAQGLEAFEGDKIEQPKINFPEETTPRFYPVTGIRQPIHPYHTTRKTVGQPPQQRAIKGKFDINAMHNAIASRLKGSMVANQSKGTYGGIYNYNAGPSGNAYYKKYHALGQETFDKIGFTPFQDNEALFTANTGRWDEFKRTMTHVFVPLAWEGFKSGPKSLVKMMQGDFTSVDDEGAKMYEELAAIGQSSRGGLFGFFNNTLVSSAYTAGILSEAILEELAGAALAAPTGGSSLAVTTANNINKLKRIPSIFKSVDRAVDGMKAMKNSLNTLDKINDTRSFWNRTKESLNTFGKILPFENTMDAVGTILRNEDNITGLARTHFALGKTVGGLYRDIKGVNMALAESRLEGAFAQNETYDKLYSDFYQANQRRPTNDEQRLLFTRAKEAGVTALGFNAALIYASNKIMFPSLLSPRGGINRWLTSKTKDIVDLKAGKIILEKTGKQVAKEGVKGKAMQGTFKYVENSFKNSIKGLIKDPKRAIPATLGYFKANFTEGIQENLQDVIAQATKNYYVDTYKDPKLANFNYGKSLFHTALSDQFTAKGFETFASGFAMGLFASPVNKSVELLSYGKSRLFNNKEYQDYIDAKQKIGTKMVNELNAMGSDPTEFFNSRITNFAVQSRANTIIKNGTTSEVNNAKSEAFISQLTTAFETDTLDYFKEHLSSFKQYTPEEFEEAFGFEKGTGAEYQSRIDDILRHADAMKNTYKSLNEKYKDTINLDDYKKGSDIYNRAAIYKMALRETKKNAVFFKHTFDDTRERMSDIGNTLLGELPLQNMTTSEMQTLFEPARMKSELDYMNVLKYRDTHYSTDPADKIKSDFLDTLTDEEKASLTDEELDQMIDEQLADLGRVRRSDEADIKIDMMLEKAYKDYLKSIADVSNDTYFDEAADKAFDKLLDYYNLNNESRSIAKYVNFLNNPGDFADLIDRHYDWMTELWNNRKDYYKDQIQQSMNAFADNALLNQLADENFYVSLDDFARWQETGEVPSEFFNDQKNIVVRDGNEDYERFEKIFNMAYLARQSGILDENLNYDEELKKELEELDAKRKEEIDALPKSEVITELDNIEPSKRGKISVQDIVDQVQPGESIDITYKTKDGSDELTIVRDEEGFKTPNGEVVNIDSLKLDITDTKRYKVEMKPDPLAEEEINDAYKNKRADIINKYAQKKEEAAEKEEEEAPVAETPAPKKEAPVVESTDEFSAMPKELQDQLQKEYQKYLEANPQLLEESENWNDEDYINALRSFVRTNGIARRIISDYNQKTKLTAATEVTGEIEKLIIKIADKEVDLTEATDEEINKNRKLLMLQISNLATKDKTPDENLRLAEAKADKAKIDRFLKRRGSNKTITPKMQEALNRLQVVFDAQKRLEKRNEAYYVDNKPMKRVTRAIEELGITEYSYSDETKVLASVNQTLLKGKSVDEFIADLRTKKPGGFSEYTYNELARELKSFLDPSKTKKATTTTRADVEKEKKEELDALVRSKGISGPKGNITTYQQALDQGFLESYPTLKEEVDAINTKYAEPAASEEPAIFQPSKPEIKTEDGVVFGAAGKMGSADDRVNQDALFVDNEKGLFIVADGMGGVNKIPFFQPHHAARLLIDKFKGVNGTNPIQIIYDLYTKNNNVKEEELFDALKKAGFINADKEIGPDHPIYGSREREVLSAYLEMFSKLKDKETFLKNQLVSDKYGWLGRAVGAVGVKAQRVAANKYEIEHVGDAVFFVVDENNNIKQAHGLSTSNLVDGFIWGVNRKGDVGFEKPNTISKYTVELKPGERLVLSSDFIETKEAIEDFIKNDFGKNLNLDSFRKKHKNDDASFIVIEHSDTQSKAPQQYSGVDQQIRDEVMAIVREKTYEDSRIAGNYIDNQIKNVFNPEIGKAEFDENKITQEAFDAIFGPEGIITDLKKKADNNEIRVFTNDIRVFDVDAGIAGEIDIIIVDREEIWLPKTTRLYPTANSLCKLVI